MKLALVVVAVAALSTASAYQCPSAHEVDKSCESISVSPLTCSNSKVNVQECNDKQCNQPYIDHYAACQCRRSPENFFDHSVNVEGLLRRCGLAGLVNPFGNLDQFRLGEGTKAFGPSTTIIGGRRATRVNSASSFTAAPIIVPTNLVPTQSHHISGGSIAGIVLGCVAATILAGLLGWCWRKKRNQHTTLYNSHVGHDNRGPTRTVVTEKIEPVVVKSVAGGAGASTTNQGTTGYSTNNPGATGYSTNNPGATGYSTNNPGATGYSTNNPGATGYSTSDNHGANNYPTTATGYNTQPRTGAVGGVNTNAHNSTIH